MFLAGIIIGGIIMLLPLPFLWQYGIVVVLAVYLSVPTGLMVMLLIWAVGDYFFQKEP